LNTRKTTKTKTMKIQTTIETITPKKAAEYLAQNYNNRRKNVRKIATLVRLIQHNKFILTHQGIAFNERGHLIDGQNRLEAIKLSGVPTKLMVTRNLPDEHKNGIMLHVIDAIDRGQTRSVADILALRHGVDSGYASLVAAIARAIAGLTTGYRGRVEAPDAAAILDIYGDDIDDIISISGHTRMLRNSNVLAGFVLTYAVDRRTTEEVLRSYFSGENLKKGNPAMTLREWVLANGGCCGDSERLKMGRLAMTAVYKRAANSPWSRANINDDATAFYLDKQGKSVQKLVELFPKQDYTKLKLELSPTPA
jgi:hypothetical protein